MDILTHTLSGLAAGTLMAGFSRGGWKYRSAIVLFSGLGGALPDIDAISMWSRFDSTFGWLFGLEHSGRVIYSEKFWYSHHGFMHSLMAAVLLALVIGVLFFLFRKRGAKGSLFRVFYDKRLLLCGFVLGFVLHLVQDMITPASSWGGVRLFFPSEVYIGGTGDIWWWNNYNLFLVVVAVLVVNLVLLLVLNLAKVKRVWRFTLGVFLVGCICFIWQVKRIDYNFNGKRYADCEKKSKEIQRELLGERMYRGMVRFDNVMRINF